MNRKIFFNTVRETLFGGSLRQQQVDGINAILAAAGKASVPQLAYVLATAYHETGARMAAVREGFARTDWDARAAVARMYRAGRISTDYAALDPATGQSYFGRGFVQLTWKKNYEKAGEELGIDLVNKPGLALDTEIAARILVEGMNKGWFTGKKLDDYIKGKKKDYVQARRIVNGLDRAELIAKYAVKFEAALQAAEEIRSA